MSHAGFVDVLARRGLVVDEAVARELYQWLHAQARRHRRRHGGGHTLCTTALVNEAWLRLFDGAGKPFESRGHFLATAALAMRCLLVDHLRRAARGERVMAELGRPEDLAPDEAGGVDVLALHEALERLAAVHERAARSVELRWFGGLTEAEVAEVQQVTERTVRRDWSFARAWLATELAPPGGDQSSKPSENSPSS